MCSCESEFTDSGCGSCASDHYNINGEPPCVFCKAATTCSSRGICDEFGACNCGQGYVTTGNSQDVFCDECDELRFGSQCNLCPGECTGFKLSFTTR